MRAILDTGVVSATDLPPLAGELAISAATLAEPHFGVLVAREQATRAERLRRTRARRIEQFVAMLARGETVYPQKRTVGD